MSQFLFVCRSKLDCLKEFTYEGSYRDTPTCPYCGGSEAKRLIGGVTPFSLKGTGWAADQYTTTDRGSQSISDKADRKGSVKSFPGQKNHG